MIVNKYSAIAVSLVSAGLLFASSALAVNLTSQAINRPTHASDQAETAKQNAQNKLQEAKLKSCQARENAITNRSVHLGQLVTTMEGNFDAIATRVENYYTTKVLSSGKPVINYNNLVTDIQTKKDAVQTSITKAQAAVAGFSCTGDDPKGQLTTFRVNMQAVKQALNDYRTSIKNLIVAVHSVTGTLNSENNSSRSSNPKGAKP